MRNSAPSVLIVALIVALTVSPPALPCISFTEDQLSETLDEVGEKIGRLLSGSAEERADIRRFPWPHFLAWSNPVSTEDREQLLDQVERMRRWLRQERDGYLALSVMGMLSTVDLVELGPLFVDALSHPAAEIRKVAVQRFVQFPDERARDTLGRLARTETRERIRIELALAHAALGDSGDADAWREWVEHGGPTFRQAGLRALAHVRDPIALEAAFELVASEADEDSALGASLLALRTDDDAAVEALVDLAGRGDRAGALAVDTLLGMRDPRADDRLIELAREDADRQRELMLSAVWQDANPRLADRLQSLGGLSAEDLRMVEEFMAEWSENLQWAAGSVGEPIARAGRSALEPMRRDPRFDESWLVLGEPVFGESRCSSHPGEGGPGGIQPRIPGGTALEDVLEVLEIDGLERVYAVVGDAGACLLPRAEIAPAGTGRGPRVSGPTRTFDVPVFVLAVDRVRQLEVERAFTVREMTVDSATIRASDELDDDARRELLQVLNEVFWQAQWP